MSVDPHPVGSTKARRVEVGFSGGQAITLRLQDDAYRALRQAVEGESRGWHHVEGEDEDVALDLSQVVFIRLDVERGRVGF